MSNENINGLEKLLTNSAEALKFFCELEGKTQIALKENSFKIHTLEDLKNYADFIMHEFN